MNGWKASVSKWAVQNSKEHKDCPAKISLLVQEINKSKLHWAVFIATKGEGAGTEVSDKQVEDKVQNKWVSWLMQWMGTALLLLII